MTADEAEASIWYLRVRQGRQRYERGAVRIQRQLDGRWVASDAPDRSYVSPVTAAKWAEQRMLSAEVIRG